MKVVTHLDPIVLERELLARLDAAHPASPGAATLVLVPTARLADHVIRRAAGLRPAWIGLEVLHFRSLAYRILEDAAADPPRLASPRLIEALLARQLDDIAENHWATFVRRRPGALRGLLRAIRDLREAGVEPAELARAGHDRASRDLAAIYRRHCEALRGRADRGWVDETGLVRAALPHAGAYARRFGAILLHGAYELIGIHLELLRALDAEVETTVLLPGDATAAVAQYSREFARVQLHDARSEPTATAAAPGNAALLRALHDEPSRPAPEPQRFAFRHTQGVLPEVRLAVRRALAAIAEGVAPEEIAICARSLEPYAAALEEVLDGERLTWTSSLATPLRRWPLVRDLLLLLRVVDEDFPRRATAELLRSPRLYWNGLLVDAPSPDGELADVWSRKARILGGLEEWAHELPRFAGAIRRREGDTAEQRELQRDRAAHRARQASVITAALRQLRTAIQPERPRTWRGHADLLEKLVARLLRGPGDDASDPAREAIDGLLDEMRGLEEVGGAGEPVKLGAMRVWLEAAVDGSQLELRRDDRRGVRVLGLPQLRGMTFRRVMFLGMNAGLFPRAPRPDPLLPDALRERLREPHRRPLALQSARGDEERLLLALLIGCASERVEISWQRADESGRAKTPSLALREIARLARGTPDLAALVQDAVRIPSHPTFGLEAIEQESGLLSPADEKLLTALRSKGPDPPELEERYPDLVPGLRMLRATESYGPGSAEYDGGVGPREERSLSVSALETLGACPLKFFFREELRVRELDEEASALEMEPREMGQHVHFILESVYRSLFSGGEPVAVETGGLRALVEAAWAETLGGLEERLTRRVPVLWAGHRDGWLRAIVAFVEEDLERIAGGEGRIEGLELRAEGRLDFGEGVVASVHGRLDRRIEGAGGARVGDYKTGANLERRIKPYEMLRGAALQVPLYRMLAGGADVELLGVGPAFDYAADDPAKRRVVFHGFGSPEVEASFLETMRVLLRLRERGRFPLHDGPHCGFCAYERGCRHTHPPTVEREAHAPDSRDYADVTNKKHNAPSLAQVRRAAGRRDGDAP